MCKYKYDEFKYDEFCDLNTKGMFFHDNAMIRRSVEFTQKIEMKKF